MINENSVLNEFINDKIEMTEEITGEIFSESDRIEFINNFVLKIVNFCKHVETNVFDVFSNFDLLVELDEMIDFNSDEAEKLVNNYLK